MTGPKQSEQMLHWKGSRSKGTNSSKHEGRITGIQSSQTLQSSSSYWIGGSLCPRRGVPCEAEQVECFRLVYWSAVGTIPSSTIIDRYSMPVAQTLPGLDPWRSSHGHRAAWRCLYGRPPEQWIRQCFHPKKKQKQNHTQACIHGPTHTRTRTHTLTTSVPVYISSLLVWGWLG